MRQHVSAREQPARRLDAVVERLIGPGVAQLGLKGRSLLALSDAWQYVSKIRGSERLLKKLYSPDRRGKDRLNVVVPYYRDLLIHIDTGDLLEWYIFFRGLYERQVIETYSRIIRPGMVILDIGANVGCHTLIMSRLVGDTGRVIAVEPNPVISRRLRTNCALNRIENIRIVEAAVAADAICDGVLTIPEVDVASASLRQAVAERLSPGAATTSVTVACRTLDALLEESGLDRVDFIKVDVEGAEYDVFSGGRRTLIEHRPHLLFEYCREAWSGFGVSWTSVSELLRELGYRCYLLLDRGRLVCVDGAGTLPWLCNLLAVPECAHPRSPP